MARPQLKVQKRKIVGKKVKQLRKEGTVPGNVFGKKTASLAVQVAYPEFNQIYQVAGETSIVDLVVGKAKTPRHTLIREVQLDPVTGRVLHVDFMQVDLKEKIETEVPLKLEGKPLLVQEKKALLLQERNELTVEAPADKLPEEIVVKVDILKEVGDTLYVKDLKVPAGVKLITDPGRVVARLAELVAKEAEELAKEEEAAAEEAKAEAAEEAEEVAAEAEKEKEAEEKPPKEESQPKKQEPSEKEKSI